MQNVPLWSVADAAAEVRRDPGGCVLLDAEGIAPAFCRSTHRNRADLFRLRNLAVPLLAAAAALRGDLFNSSSTSFELFISRRMCFDYLIVKATRHFRCD